MPSVFRRRWGWTGIAAVTHSPKSTVFYSTKSYDFERVLKEEYWKWAYSKNRQAT